MGDPDMIVKVYIETNAGLKRENNEDSYQLVYRQGEDYDIDSLGMMFAVADGIGGHTGGQFASRIACEALLEYYTGKVETKTDTETIDSRMRHLKKVIWKIEEEISRLGEEIPKYAYMGTTLSVLVLLKGHALIAHVGDSRIYRFRKASLKQLTIDETMAHLSVEMGYLQPDDANDHPLSHILSQALGGGLEKVYTRTEKMEAGDIFLLCSDGLYNMISDKKIYKILNESSDTRKVCKLLIKTALNRGGEDNITAILVETEHIK
jgi:protein phosphatase